MFDDRMENNAYKTITVPVSTYKMLKELKTEMAENGINSIPKEAIDILRSNRCPRCGSEMDGVEVKFGYYRCPNCEFEKPIIDLKFLGSFALGAIASVAIVLGLRYLFGGDY